MLSARSEQALANQARRLLAHVSANAELRPVDVAWSLATTRAVFDHRAAVVGARPGAADGGVDRVGRR